MTKDDITTLARQAEGTPYVNRHYPGVTSFGFNETTLLAFAKLVAAAEREACAKLETEAGVYTTHDLAAAIRAKGNT